MESELPDATLMTGATGFLGHFVLRELLDRGERVVAMVRSPLSDSRRRLGEMLAAISSDMDAFERAGQLTLVEGSLPDGLPEPTWGRTSTVLHGAASLQLFSNGNGDPHVTNVKGTAAVIAWAERHGVRRIHAVSTAYTCGWRDGLIPEAFHLPEPEFQTDYERSKWTAEFMLREWSLRDGNTLTLLRPSFLIGDSTTGYTTQFGGFYQFARLVGALKERFATSNNGELTYIPLRIPGKPDDRQNIVPVDFVGRVVAEVITRPEFHGRIYHLTNPEPPTNGFMKRCYEEYFGLHGGDFADPDDVVGKCSLAESLLWDKYHLITPRVVHTPVFDVTHTREVMQAGGITFPALDGDRIRILFDYAKQHNWGRGTDGFHG